MQHRLLLLHDTVTIAPTDNNTVQCNVLQWDNFNMRLLLILHYKLTNNACNILHNCTIEIQHHVIYDCITIRKNIFEKLQRTLFEDRI